MKKIVDILKKDKSVNRNYWIGLRIQTVDANIAKYYKLNNVTGVIVVSVENGSPADDAGIKADDVVIEMNGQKVASDVDFWGIITDMDIGDMIKLKILRNGDEIEKDFKLVTK